MHNALSAIIRAAVVSCLLAAISSANAAPPSPEQRYVAARDAAIAKISKLYDNKKPDDALKAETAAGADLLTLLQPIMAESGREGFRPAKLNLERAAQMGAAFKDESFYTQAISTDAAIINFGELPIAKPAAATFAFAMLAARTQDAIPDGKAGYDKKADKAADDLQSSRIDRKAYDKLGDLRQQGEDAYKRCFILRAPQQPSFVEAIRQAEALLTAAIGK